MSRSVYVPECCLGIGAGQVPSTLWARGFSIHGAVLMPVKAVMQPHLNEVGPAIRAVF